MTPTVTCICTFKFSEKSLTSLLIFFEFLVKKPTRLETNARSKTMPLILEKEITQQNLKEGQMCQHIIVHLSLKAPCKLPTGIAPLPLQLPSVYG